MEMTIRGNYLSTTNFFIDEPLINIELDALDLDKIVQTCLDRIISDRCDCCVDCDCGCNHDGNLKVQPNAAIWRFNKGDNEWQSIFDNLNVDIKEDVSESSTERLDKKSKQSTKCDHKEKDDESTDLTEDLIRHFLKTLGYKSSDTKRK